MLKGRMYVNMSYGIFNLQKNKKCLKLVFGILNMDTKDTAYCKKPHSKSAFPVSVLLS